MSKMKWSTIVCTGLLAIGIMTSGCGPSQMLGATFTPTPQPTATFIATPTTTPTATPEPTATETPTPVPEVITKDLIEQIKDNSIAVRGSNPQEYGADPAGFAYTWPIERVLKERSAFVVKELTVKVVKDEKRPNTFYIYYEIPESDGKTMVRISLDEFIKAVGDAGLDKSKVFITVTSSDGFLLTSIPCDRERSSATAFLTTTDYFAHDLSHCTFLFGPTGNEGASISDIEEMGRKLKEEWGSDKIYNLAEVTLQKRKTDFRIGIELRDTASK